MSQRGKPLCPAVQRWEDAHSCLLSALTSYVDTCTRLKNSSLAGLATDIGDLVPQIERHITSLSSFVAYQISQTRSILSAARNQLASPIYMLPEETLAEIFAHVIYDPTENKTQPMEQDLRSIYRQLYNLMGVCTSWRNIAVRRKSFWAIIPMINKCKCSNQPLEDVTERSLRRSGGTGLYIAASISLRVPALLHSIVSYGKHIQALNIQTESRHKTKEVMSTLAVFTSPGILSELSICFDPIYSLGYPTVEDREIIRQPFQHQERLKQILGSLRALRIRVAYIDIYDVIFANLVELRIERLTIGHSPILKRLLRAISSASNLQYLHLDSVTSYASSESDSTHEADERSISLPKIKSVYLANMFFNDLEEIFKSFVPGNEKWILSLGARCITVNLPYPRAYFQSTDRLHDLWHILRGFQVDTLILSGRQGGSNWLDGSELAHLLGAVPNITTLKVDYWIFRQEDWEALAHSQNPGAGHSRFPFIRSLYISNARIFDEYGIQTVVSGHNLQYLRLGGCLSNGLNDESAITGNHNVAVWLASNVSDFRLMASHSDPIESKIDEWRLW